MLPVTSWAKLDSKSSHHTVVLLWGRREAEEPETTCSSPHVRPAAELTSRHHRARPKRGIRNTRNREIKAAEVSDTRDGWTGWDQVEVFAGAGEAGKITFEEL